MNNQSAKRKSTMKGMKHMKRKHWKAENKN